MRGHIDLTGHKLAGLYRGHFAIKRTRLVKRPDDAYAQIWRIVDGGVRRAFNDHPEYLVKGKRDDAVNSIVKRVTGDLHGYATQVAWDRSCTAVRIPGGQAVKEAEALVGKFSLRVIGLKLLSWCAFTTGRGAATTPRQFSGE